MCGNVTFPCRFFRLRTKHDFEQAGSLRFVLLPECLQRLNGLQGEWVLIHPARPQALPFSVGRRLSSRGRRPDLRRSRESPTTARDPLIPPLRSLLVLSNAPAPLPQGMCPRLSSVVSFMSDPSHGAMRLHRMIRAENGSALGCLLQAPDQS